MPQVEKTKAKRGRSQRESLTIILELVWQSTTRRERQLGTPDMVNQQPYPVGILLLPPRSVAHTPLSRGPSICSTLGLQTASPALPPTL